MKPKQVTLKYLGREATKVQPDFQAEKVAVQPKSTVRVAEAMGEYLLKAYPKSFVKATGKEGKAEVKKAVLKKKDISQS